jgi:hypothetical protein
MLKHVGLISINFVDEIIVGYETYSGTAYRIGSYGSVGRMFYVKG